MKHGDYLKNLREEQIKKSALELFSRKGFQNTTVAEIAESAGLSKGLIYWYWDSKEGIAFSLVKEMLSDFLEVIQDASNKEGNFINRFMGLIDAVAELYYAEKTQCLLSRKLVMDNPREKSGKNAREIDKYYTKIVDSLAEFLQQGIRDGEIKEIGIRFYSLLMLGITEGLEGIWLENEDDFNIRDALRTVMTFVLDGIKK